MRNSQSCRHCIFIDLQNRNRRVVARRHARLIACNSCGKLPVIAIVHHSKLKATDRVLREKAGPVLRVKPIGRVRASH